MSGQDEERQERKGSEEDVQDLDLDTEEGQEMTERVRGGRRAISIP